MNKTGYSIRLVKQLTVEKDPLRQMAPKCTWATRRVKGHGQRKILNITPCVLNSFWVRNTWTSEKAFYVHNVGTGRKPEIKVHILWT
jgi:hypothetical protein